VVATKEKRHVNSDHALQVVIKDYLERHDPVRKARRQKMKAQKIADTVDVSQLSAPSGETQTKNQDCNRGDDPGVGAEKSQNSRPITINSARSESVAPVRRPVSAHTKHTVFNRDGGRCTFRDTSGQRCASERWLHLHHIRPVSSGGGNAPENLSTLCSFHHDLVHQLGFAIEGQVNWLKEPGLAYH